jgi:hypothetical protein
MGGHTKKGGQLFYVREEIADEGENHCSLILSGFPGKLLRRFPRPVL